MFGYKKMSAWLQALIVFENLTRLRWEWIFTGKVGASNG